MDMVAITILRLLYSRMKLIQIHLWDFSNKFVYMGYNNQVTVKANYLLVWIFGVLVSQPAVSSAKWLRYFFSEPGVTRAVPAYTVLTRLFRTGHHRQLNDGDGWTVRKICKIFFSKNLNCFTITITYNLR